MVHNKNARARREGALTRLKASKFFEKTNKKGEARTPEAWQTRKDAEIATLEQRLNTGY